MKTFSKYFVIFAWVFAIASHWSVASGVVMMLSGVLVIIETINDWRKDDAKRRAK